MNVAVTRAKRFVCIVGDSETVSSDPFLKNLIKYFEEHGEVRFAQEYRGAQYDVRFGMGIAFSDKASLALEEGGGVTSSNLNST